MSSKGRPKGTTGPRKPKTAVQTLKPQHDRIVYYHIAGLTNVEIAGLLNITEQTVSNILGDPKALELIDAGRRKIKEKLLENIDDQVISLAQKSLKNLEKTVNANIKVSHPAKRHQDKVGIDLLKMVGYQSGGERGNTGGVPTEVIDRLTTALSRSDKAREIEIQDVEFEEIPNDEQERKVV